MKEKDLRKIIAGREAKALAESVRKLLHTESRPPVSKPRIISLLAFKIDTNLRRYAANFQLAPPPPSVHRLSLRLQKIVKEINRRLFPIAEEISPKLSIYLPVSISVSLVYLLRGPLLLQNPRARCPGNVKM